MIIGFVLLVSSCGADFCEALPVTDDIYLNLQSCELAMETVHNRYPTVILSCGEVWREGSE